MRRLGILVSVFLLASFCAAGRKEEPLESLKARAEAARPSEQGHLFAEVAWREVEVANSYYTAGEVEKAQAAVQEVVSYAEKAQAAAQKSGKKLKETEITIRKTARRLDDVRKTLAFEDRPAVAAAIERLEQVRKALLDQMFGPPKEKKK